jgi:phenylacetyl-CoA:acceptor oxidoreductase
MSKSKLKGFTKPVKKNEGTEEDTWVSTLCESQCADAPCLLKVRRVNGVAMSIEPNTEIEDFEKLTKNQGRLCPKPYGILQKLYNPYRIKGPLKRTNPQKGRGIDPKWVDISWNEALTIIVEKLKKIRAEDTKKLAEGGGIGGMRQACWSIFFHAFGPTQLLYGGRSTRCDQNEHAFGNRIHGGFQCEPDIDYCNYLLLFGSNTSTSGGTVENVLFASARERGMKIIAIDPVLSVTAAKSDEWLPIRPCTDLALMLAMIHTLIHELGVYDKEFLKEMTNSPYLVQPNGYFMRDRVTEKVLIWDPVDQTAKAYDDATIKDLALEGCYGIEGIQCKTAFQALKEHVAHYTAEWAASITDIPAETIRRISKEFVENARIGSTIEIQGVKLPFRPVATKLGRGVMGVMRSYQTVLANHILAALVGSIEIPGGHMGGTTFQKGKYKDGILWKLYQLDAGVIPGKDGMREVNHYPFVWPPISYGAIETLCPMSDYAPAKPPYTDPSEFHFQMDHLNWRNLVDPPKGLPVPPPPEMWIRYRTNPLLGLGESEIILDAIKKIPFIVSISYVMDEVTEFADIVLPEQIEFERYMPYFNIRNACHKKYFMLALGQPVVTPVNTMNINDMLIELADRIGMLDEFNELVNQKMSLKDTNKLEPGKKYTWMEITDRLCKSYTNNAYDLEWFKKNGALVRPVDVEEQYDIHLAMKAQKLRYPIPYMEEVKKVGEELTQNLAKVGIDWWPTNEYTALPTYFPSKLDEVPSEYDFYVTTCRAIMFSYGSNMGLPWMNEIAKHVTGVEDILMNADAAEVRGIKEGDEIWVESPVGKVKRKVKLCQGIRPDTLLITGQFGQWAMPIAKDTGRVTLSTLVPIDYSWTDPVIGVQQGLVVKAKVYKAQEGRRRTRV